MISEWKKRLSAYVNLAAKAGPASTAEKEQIEEALANITWRYKCKTYNRQQACKHLKGGKYRSGPVKDYALTTHTFVDSRTRIKCMLCGLEAWSHSGEDFKFNWLASLAEISTNCPSASERLLLAVKIGGKKIAEFPNTYEGRAALRRAYPNWDGKIDGEDEFPEDSVYSISAADDRWVQFPSNHSPIKGLLASTLESAEGTIVAADEGIIVVVQDSMLDKEKE